MLEMKIRLLSCVLTMVCLGWATGVRAQTEVLLDLYPPMDTIYIGDRVTLRVRVKAPIRSVVFFPKFGSDDKSGVEVLEMSEVDTLKAQDKGLKGADKRLKDSVIEFRLLEKRYVMTSFEPGGFGIHDFIVFVLSPSGVDTVRYAGPGVDVVVKPADLAEDFQPYDIRNVRGYPSRLWMWVCLFVLIGLALVALVVYLVKRYRAKRALEVVPFKKINPYEWAVGELAQLKSENISTARTKEYYSRLTDIVREYIELQGEVSVMEKTSDEILAVLPSTVFNSPRLIERVKNLFSIADLVKFAKYRALLSECETSWIDATAFVDESNRKINESEQSERDKATDAAGDSSFADEGNRKINGSEQSERDKVADAAGDSSFADEGNRKINESKQ